MRLEARFAAAFVQRENFAGVEMLGYMKRMNHVHIFTYPEGITGL